MDECHGQVELYRNHVFLHWSTFRVDSYLTWDVTWPRWDGQHGVTNK